MSDPVSEPAVAQTIDAIYDAALAPDLWPLVLERISFLFRCHFADLFTRSHDRSRYAGLPFGLDRADYQEQFLDTWMKRNVWGLSKPTQTPGEVISTRQMVAMPDLMRSDIFVDYLNPRDLHEGLRLSLWADESGIQDISLLRSWSAGPFEAVDLELGRYLVPHLQRAARIARRLDYADAASQAGLLALDSTGFAMILLDTVGRPLILNRPAERLVQNKDGLTIEGRELRALSREAARSFRQAIARALPIYGRQRSASTVLLPRSDAAPLTAVTIPLSRETGWTLVQGPAVVVLVNDPSALGPSASQLVDLFGLTNAEAELARELLGGFDLRDIALRRGRSIYTLRAHLARLMSKTDTARQSQLVKVLRGLPSTDVSSPPG